MKSIALLSLAGVLVLIALFSLTVGSTKVPLADLLAAFVGGSDAMTRTIVLDIRLPRVLLAILVGAGVATAGAAIQGLFRNPLADPALIGVSSGAALFGSGFIVLGLGDGIVGTLGVPGAAFIGGLVATGLVLEIGRHGGTISSMLLGGVAINAMAIAGVGVFSYLSSDVQLRSVAFWALGSFGAASWSSVLVAGVIPVAVCLLLLDAQRLNVMTLGDAEAGHLGVGIQALRVRIVIYTALVVGVGVALSGIIAFVGLVVPHLVRLALGSNHHVVIPGAAILGAILVVLADCASRVVVAPAELPVGILTALIGGPFFIYLIIEQKGKLGL